MASAIECESLSMNKDFLLKKDDGGDELNGELELSLDLSLGGSMGKSKDKKKENPCLQKYPSGNLQPCLRKFASGNFDESGEESKRNIAGIDIDSGRREIWNNWNLNKPSAAVTSGPLPLSRSLSGAVSFEEMKPLVLPNESSGKPAWPHHFMHTSAPNTMVQNGTGHPRILRTCSVGTLGAGFMTPSPSSVLHRQPSLDVLMPDQNQESVQSTRQKEALEQQRKREMHALRRQEARKKREEKKARRDEGKSFSENKVSVSFPVSSGAILSSNKWMLNPELSTTTQTSQNEMDRKEGKSKPKSLLETQRSLKRDREKVSKEVEPWIEKEKRVKKKKSGNGSMDPLPYDFDMETKVSVPDHTETRKLMGGNVNGNCSTRRSSSPGRGNSTRNTNSPGRGNSGSEEKNSNNLYENGHKSSSSNIEDCESTISRSQATNCEASASPSASPSTSVAYTNLPFPVVPITYPYAMAGASGQCMPLPIGFSIPYMMPYWTPAIQPTGSEPSKSNVPHMPNVIQPASAFGIPPSQMPIHGTLPSWLSAPKAKGTPASVQNSHSSGGSLATSSSIPDQDRKSSEGSSSDETKSQSIKSVELSQKGFQSLTRYPSVSKAEGQILSISEVSVSHKAEQAQLKEAAEKIPCSSAQSDFENPPSKTFQERTIDAPSKKKPTHFVSPSNEKKQNSSCHSAPDHISEETQTKQTQDSKNETQDQDNNSDLKATRNSQLDNGLLHTFHRVTTTGIGPKGITISGILSYSSNQVRIVCVCHGTQMSPAEFVQHAGSTDISNPERNIVVTPTPFIIPATSARG
ncbi:hypothetical protein SUGI_0667990 [Cryptomeria japonica]|uniref:uncharacterized protein LOC131030830 n=1 Tax=Cryptomeria japonica TaxID=3369 RepID=UPI002414A6FF|nr:uncharacterized protein LOC131030830 [Cryptomeria japonica]GLJ33178.1 hypothetical protein SUGI_0667990 [Cryptomeria japonica]